MTFTTPMVLMLQLKAEIILSQGLPRHIFNILNQTNTAKEIWDNVEMLMQGSGRTLQQRKEDLFDEFERISASCNTKQFLFHHPLTSQPQPAVLSPNDPQCMAHYDTDANLCMTAKLLLKPFREELQGMLETQDREAIKVMCKEPKRAKDSQYFKDKMLLIEAKEKGVTLDAEAEAFLANVELWMRPYAGSVSWPNLSSTNANNHHVNEVHPNAIQINDSVNYQLSHEMHHEEQSDSDVESELDDNTTPYHQLELERRAIVFQLKDIYIGHMLYLMVTILDEMRDTLDEKTQENQDLSLENQNLKAELAKCKLEIVRLDTQQVKLDLERQVRQEQNLVTQRNEENS
ncbi:hypothetical protein Tco_0373395 [Tanacetum coccineum]